MIPMLCAENGEPSERLLDSLAQQPFETVFSDVRPLPATGARRCMTIRSDNSWMVKNRDTGETRAVSSRPSDQQFSGIPVDPKRLAESRLKPWSSWWAEKKCRDQELLEAAKAGHAATLRLLLNPKDGGPPASVGAARSASTWGPLHLAAANGCVEAVEVLLSAGAGLDLQIEDHRQFTALHLAASQGRLAVAERLLQAGADAGILTAERNLALHLAAAAGHPELVALLLERGSPEQTQRRNALGQRPAEAAMDAATALVFEMAGKMQGEDSYARRTPIGKEPFGILQRNARSDAVLRLLSLMRQGSCGGQGSSCSRAALAESQSCEAAAESSHLPSSKSILAKTSSLSCKSVVSIPTPSRSRDLISHALPRAPFARIRETGSSVEEIGPSSFEVVQLLGRGAFGEVFQVRHKRTGQDYAMKVQLKHKIFSQQLLRYAKTERNLLAYIRHPYIVSLHYAFQTPSHLVLVLQYCSGGSLQQLIRKSLGQVFNERLAQLYTAEILLALIHLHERSVLFRDLKPDNVVIDKYRHAMLTDFGLSKEGVVGRSARTFCGSVAYVAPEILLGKMHGHTVDIYNLGVLLYNMLTGMPPFFDAEKDKMHLNIKLAKLELPTFLSSAAVSFISATMVRDPCKRLGTARTTDVQEHVFFADINFVALMLRKVEVADAIWPPALMKSTRCRTGTSQTVRNPFGATGKRENSWRLGGFRKRRAANVGSSGDGGVVGWEFQSPTQESP
eukprot:TRINITY_DN90643_c0_g1_i1.p1 TRINITY_DN90643_c0_g1~~TRINITY_DN90643_c0_g1_i1.p1  ORF type:complete len:735 (-),score=130.42 TRINITY_DN90643_c0_g1_i1:40-2244(-)